MGNAIYSGTSLIRTPLEQKKSVLIREVSSFQGWSYHTIMAFGQEKASFT